MRPRRSAAALTLAALALAGASGRARAGGDDVDDSSARPRSVYRIEPAADTAVMAIAGAAALVPYLLQDRIIRERCPCDRSEVPRFERWVIDHRSNAADHASDALVALSIAGPFALDSGAVGWSRPLLEDGLVLAETVLVNGALVTTVKDLVQRPTPRAYAGDAAIVRRPTGYRAFYSGHESNTVAALTAAAWTARLRYGPSPWAWAVVGALGAAVGALRIAGGNHFPTDVAAGAAAGLAIGTAMPLLHRRAGHALTLVPSPGGLAVAGAL